MSYDLGKVVGSDGKGIASIVKTDTTGLVDTYTITYTNGDTTTFTVTNGKDALADIVTSWESTLSDTKVASEKLVKNSLDDKISKSSTSGLVKNDGSIDTSTYLKSSDIVDNLTTNDSTKVLSAKQGKALNDLIGAAITYINQ